MKTIIKLTFIFICNITLGQTNLLDTSSWFEGTGSVSGFNKEGADSENIREIGIGPHNASVLLWKGTPNDNSIAAGGWISELIQIDHSKTYRFTVWAKKTNSFDGYHYFNARARDASGNVAVNTLDGTSATNPIFSTKDLPTLDEWYLFVGYMHHSSYSNTVSIGGIYSGSTGAKMLNISDFKFKTTSTQIEQTIVLHDVNPNDSHFLYGPTMYEVNGQEPSIQDIINAQPDSQKPSKPILSSVSNTDTTVDLSWTAATDNIGVTGYKVYKGGVLEATLGNVLAYQVTNLTPATTYNFTVTALDSAGNESIVSSTLGITTDSAYPPVTNLLDTSVWAVGTGPVVGFNILGTNNDNTREIGVTPYGTSEVLWKSQPVNDIGNRKGWETDYVNIDHTKTYRYTTWVKKSNSQDGLIYLSFTCKDEIGNNTGLNLSGSVNGAPYPFSGDTPHLEQWYLLVGYIHQSGYTSTTSIGGVYDTNGVKQSNMEDYKFSSEATRFALKTYLTSSTNTSNQFFTFAPTIYEVNGQEPSIQELINAQPINNPTYPSGNLGYWSLNNQDVYYTDGNVGIGTSIPDSKLTVKGNIHSEEVKVDLSVPAPDYVFDTDYKLTPLETLQRYIKQNNHLPNIPSAKELEAHGVELGSMNMKLLEKIEEMTLYILEQQNQLDLQKSDNKTLKSRLTKLETLIKNNKE